jgi:predicted RNase H-like HicB family nuclease
MFVVREPRHTWSLRAAPSASRSVRCCTGGAMKLPVTLEHDESGWIVAECPSIPGCVSQGKTEEEALAKVREAAIACLEVRAEQGLPLTVRSKG